jgi:hypothetical protein
LVWTLALNWAIGPSGTRVEAGEMGQYRFWAEGENEIDRPAITCLFPFFEYIHMLCIICITFFAKIIGIQLNTLN